MRVDQLRASREFESSRYKILHFSSFHRQEAALAETKKGTKRKIDNKHLRISLTRAHARAYLQLQSPGVPPRDTLDVPRRVRDKTFFLVEISMSKSMDYIALVSEIKTKLEAAISDGASDPVSLKTMAIELKASLLQRSG